MFEVNYIDEIISNLASCCDPTKVDKPGFDTVCQLSKSCFTGGAAFWSVPSIESLLLSFFKLSLDLTCGKSGVDSLWSEGVKALVKIKGGHIHEEGFLNQSTILLKQKIFSGAIKDIASLENMIDKTKMLIEPIKKLSSAGFENGVLTEMVNLLLPSETEWATLEELDNPIVMQYILWKKRLYLPDFKYGEELSSEQCEGSLDLTIGIIAAFALSVLQHSQDMETWGDIDHLDHVAFAVEFMKGMVDQYSQSKMVSFGKDFSTLFQSTTHPMLTLLKKSKKPHFFLHSIDFFFSPKSYIIMF